MESDEEIALPLAALFHSRTYLIHVFQKDDVFQKEELIETRFFFLYSIYQRDRENNFNFFFIFLTLKSKVFKILMKKTFSVSFVTKEYLLLKKMNK